MPPRPLSIRSFPKAILHIDGDAFFASCEQALNPALRGKPVITGKERGIVSAASYEAKRLGVKTGMLLRDAKKVCPSAIILSSNYEAYSIFSMRMYEIVRRYTSAVEEYSIDECFADITGLRRPLKMSYPEIGKAIKSDLDRELGMTFSVGLAPTKVLAKVGSKWQKPNGLTLIPAREAHLYLFKTPIEKIWGIGPQTSMFLQKNGIKNAYEFASRDEFWIKRNLSKPFQEIYYELRCVNIYAVNTEAKESYASISKTKTFSPSSTDRDYVFSQLSKNIENACIKLRRYNLRTKKATIFLKTDDFRYRTLECEFVGAINTPESITSCAERRFSEIWRSGVSFRASGVVLENLSGGAVQQDLFGARDSAVRSEKIYEQIDALDERYGKHTVFLGSSMEAVVGKKKINFRNAKSDRYTAGDLLKGETSRQHLNIPLIGFVE